MERAGLIMWGSSSEVSNDKIKEISELLPELCWKEWQQMSTHFGIELLISGG